MKKIFLFLILFNLFGPALAFSRSDFPSDQKPQVALDPNKFFQELIPTINSKPSNPLHSNFEINTDPSNRIVPTFFNTSSTSDDLAYLAAPSLEDWLWSHPAVAEAIIWEDEAGNVLNWTQWDASRKNLLQRAFENMWDVNFNSAHIRTSPSSVFFVDPPPYATHPRPDSTDPVYYYNPQIAWATYNTYLAHSLVLELGNILPWSLTEYNRENLLLLLDSRKIFQRIPAFPGYRLAGDGAADLPQTSFSFLFRERLLSSDKAQTIQNLLNWSRNNFSHMLGEETPLNLSYYYNYEYAPPVSEMLSGSRSPMGTYAHWTSGCGGTVSFLNWILRSVNIPTQLLSEGGAFGLGHSQIYFPTEGRYLAHGDDPYSAFVKFPSSTPIPIEAIFIDEETYSRWFRGSTRTFVARRTHDIAIEYLPIPILQERCDDVANRRPVIGSHVYNELLQSHSAAELSALQSGDPTQDLWSRMDAEIERQGGCGSL